MGAHGSRDVHGSLPKAEVQLLRNMFDGLASQSHDKSAVSKTTFLRYVDFPGLFGERLFALFDTKRNGTIDLEEFMSGVSVYMQGSTEERIRLLFKLYDLEGDNGVSQEELRTMLYSLVNTPHILDMLTERVAVIGDADAETADEEEDDDENTARAEDDDDNRSSTKSPKEAARATSAASGNMTPAARAQYNDDMKDIVDRICTNAFETCDTDKSGKLDFPQFRKWCRQTPHILLMLEKVFAKHAWSYRSAAQVATDSATDVDLANTLSKSVLIGRCEKCDWEPCHCPHCGKALPLRAPLICNNKAGGCSSRRVFGGATGTLSFCMQCGAPWSSVNDQSVSIRRRPSLLAMNEHRARSRVKGGHLLKLRKHLKTFKEDYYVVKKNFLYTFDSDDRDDMRKPSRVLFLEGLFIEIPETDDYASKSLYGFEIVSVERRFMLFARSQSERQRWVSALRAGAKTIPIEEVYDIGPEIGQGRFATIHLATSMDEKHEKYAVKIIDKAKVEESDREAMRNEIAILRLCKHPHVIGFREVFESTRHLYVVLTLVEGGDLLTYLDSLPGRHMPEEPAANVVRKVLEALKYLHARGIVHRDIKPENVLIGSRDNLEDVFVADFGLSCFSTPSEKMSIAHGTLAYMAPEMLMLQSYTKAVDAWGVGVLTYIVLSGEFPFHSSDRMELIDLIIEKDVQFKGPTWDVISAQAKDFIRGLMNKSPNSRFTVQQALDHPWMEGTAHKPILPLSPTHSAIERQQSTTSAMSSNSAHTLPMLEPLSRVAEGEEEEGEKKKQK